MPRSKTPKKLSRKELYQKSKFGGYINCDLTEKGRADFGTWFNTNADNVPDVLNRLLVGGYTLKVHFDDEQDNYTATLTRVIQETMKVWILSAFHPDFDVVLGVLVYKHLVILDGDWSTHTGSNEDKPLWG